MSSETATIVTITVGYLSVVLAIGWWSYKVGLSTPEDFFMANRGFGTAILLMAIYATNMTAFYMLGTPGNAYRQGIGTYGYIAFASALVIPAMFYLIGYRVWLVANRHGYMTPSEVYGARWDSDAVSLAFFALLVTCTIPYLVTAVIGGGLAIESLTKGEIPYFWGAGGILFVTILYTTIGGMRGTAWTNVFQGTVFIAVAFAAFLLIAGKLGGLSVITAKVLAERPELLQRAGNFDPRIWFSFMLIPPLAVIVFPQVFIRVLTAKSHRTLKRLTMLYPFLFLLTWPPVIYIGAWGRVLFPGLGAKAADSILPLMIGEYLPTFMLGFGLAGILAAIMSSIDAMLLTMSTMLTRDILKKYRPELTRRREVLLGRGFVIAIGALVFIGAIVRPGTIYAIATFAFTGYVLAIPMMIGGLYWRRSTKYGALASIIVPFILLPFYFFTPYLNWSTFGFLPVFPLLLLSLFLFFAVSLLTPPPSEKATRRFYDLYEGLYR